MVNYQTEIIRKRLFGSIDQYTIRRTLHTVMKYDFSKMHKNRFIFHIDNFGFLNHMTHIINDDP